jgi:hypothetical protein
MCCFGDTRGGWGALLGPVKQQVEQIWKSKEAQRPCFFIVVDHENTRIPSNLWMRVQ